MHNAVKYHPSACTRGAGDMDAPSSSRALRMQLPPDVNLYCLQCEAQIGIFANEWLRLTSSYARSKEKGTHFGTEVGQRTQVVPQGPAPNAAAGCEMAEVFCRKCSNMVGQFCKRAPVTAKQDIVDQYFYKLSRTFLKDSKTNMRVEPVYGFSDGFTRAVPGRFASSIPRVSMTPTSRWTHTPLRESSSTPSVQTATRSVLRDGSMPSLRVQPLQDNTPYMVNEVMTLSQPQLDRLDQELDTQNVMLRDHSSRIASQAAQAANHEGRMRDHDARLQNQEMRTRLHLSQIQQQEATIAEQQSTIERQEAQLKNVSQQLQSLHSSMADLRALIGVNKSTGTVQHNPSASESNLIESLETMLQTVKEARSSNRELQTLRSQNEDLQSRLDIVLGAVESRSTSRPESRSSGGEISFDGTQASHVLGKRKRERSSIGQPALRSEESPSIAPKRSVRFEEQHTDHAPRSQPTSAEQPLSQQVSGIQYSAVDTAQTGSSISANDNENRDKDQEPTTSEQLQHNLVEPEKQSDTSREPAKLPESTIDAAAGTPQQADTVTRAKVHDTTRDQNDHANKNVSSAGIEDSSPHDNGLQQSGVPDAEAAGDSSQLETAEPSSPAHSTFIQDTSMFDAVEFSDDDDELAFGSGGAHDSDMTGEDDDTGVRSSKTSSGSNRRVTDSWIARNQRSLAPEPHKRRRMTTSNAIKPVNMDRIHIGTPAIFEAAILKGHEPKLGKPPAINTRQKDLHDELTRLGLSEWIGRDKKNKEYRNAVTAARARYRNSKKAALLSANGLNPDYTDAGTALPEQPLTEPPSVAARKLVLTQIYNPSASVAPQVQTAPGDENSQSFQLTADKTAAQSARDDNVETAPDQRMTRARARRSSTSIAEHMDPPRIESDVVTTDAEPRGKKRRSDTNKKPSQQRKSTVELAAGSDSTDTAAVDTIEDAVVDDQTDNNLQKDADQTSKRLTRSRGRPRKSNVPILTPDTTIGSPQIDSGAVGNTTQDQAFTNHQPSPVSLSNSPLPQSRQSLLAKMKARAEERDNAIAMRDQLAKETMEREMAMGI